MPIGLDWEEVGFGFNRESHRPAARTLGFDGIVCTDWGLLNDSTYRGEPMPARAWGVEHLSPLERAEKLMDAGVDQFGGEGTPELIVELVRSGRITEARIDQSVRRLLREKFVLGLFDEPVPRPRTAERTIGSDEFAPPGRRPAPRDRPAHRRRLRPSALPMPPGHGLRRRHRLRCRRPARHRGRRPR